MEANKEVVMMLGLPFAGKSTWIHKTRKRLKDKTK